jgi:hypothetical protein
MKAMLYLSVALPLSACAGLRQAEPTTPPVKMPAQVRRPAPDFRPLGTSGAAEAVLHVEPLPALGARLEIRTIGVGQGTELVLPTENELALEVRTGNVAVAIDGQRTEHVAGDIFMVLRGARVTISPLGQAATLRAIALIMQ